MTLREQLLKFDGTETLVNLCLEVVRRADRIIIFGAGVGGVTLYNLLATNKLEDKIIAWSDNNYLKFGKPFLRIA